MKLKLCTALLTVATIFASLSLAAEQVQDAGAKRNAIEKYGRLPLSFEPTGSAQQFLARSGNYTVSVGARESSVVVTDTKSGKHQMLRFTFDNANPSVRLEALEPQAGVTNYYIGQDPAQVAAWGEEFCQASRSGRIPRRGRNVLRRPSPVGIRFCNCTQDQSRRHCAVVWGNGQAL